MVLDLEALLGVKAAPSNCDPDFPIVWFYFGAHVCGLEERGGGGGGSKKEGTGNRVIPTELRRMLEMPSSCVPGEERGLVSIWWSLCHSNSMPCFGVMKRQRLNDYHERHDSRVDLRRKFVISIAPWRHWSKLVLSSLFYHRSIIQPKTAVLFFNLHHMHPVPHGNKWEALWVMDSLSSPEVDTSL